MKGFDEVSDMFDSFPSFSYKIFSDMSRGDASVHNENAYLRDCLEKERYRRKVKYKQFYQISAVATSKSEFHISLGLEKDE